VGRGLVLRWRGWLDGLRMRASLSQEQQRKSKGQRNKKRNAVDCAVSHETPFLLVRCWGDSASILRFYIEISSS
jgi:hypothetical protein